MARDVYCRYLDSYFTAEEIEAVTGVVPALQRTWKQRGFLRQGKHARGRLTAHDLVQIMTLQIASQSLRVEMNFVHEGVAAAVPPILWYALSNIKAWDVDGTTEQKAAFKESVASDNMKDLPYLDKLIGLKPGELARYVLFLSEGPKFVGSLDDAFDDENTPAGLALDLMAIAKKLVKSPERPRGLFVATDIEVGKRQSFSERMEPRK